MGIKINIFKMAGSESFRFYVWLALLLGGMFPMGYYVARYFLYGVPIFSEYIGSSVPWGLLVPVYIFFVLAGSGLCLISSIGHVFKVGEFELISRRATFIALVMMLTGFTAIAVDLGRIDRVYVPFLVRQNYSSPMMWMITLYVIYFVAILFEFWLLTRLDFARKSRESSGLKSIFYTVLTMGRRSVIEESEKTDHRIARVIGVVALMLAISATSNLGSIFGTTKARPFWSGPYMPIFFILTAFVSGTAILLFITLASFKVSRAEPSDAMRSVLIDLGKILGLLIAIDLFFIAWKTMTSMYSVVPHEVDAQTLLLTGPFMLQFWGLEIIIGVIAPFFLLLYPKTGRSTLGLLTASLLVIVGIFFARYDPIVAGQIVSALEGPVLIYYPTATEISLVVSLTAFAAFIYTIGRRILPLSGLE